MGRRFSEWTNRAPTLEAAVAAAAITQDEVGHARGLYAALHGHPDSPEAYLLEERPARLFSLPALAIPFGGWPDLVAANVLFDRAMTLVFEAARDSRYEPLRQRTAKILQEERFHRMYGEGWLKRLAAASPKARGVMQAAIVRLWNPVIDWIGSSSNRGLLAGSLLSQSADALRARWLAEVTPLLAACGLAVPDE